MLYLLIVYGTPPKYKCYVLTIQDQERVRELNDNGIGEAIAQAMICERNFGNVYSGGTNKFTPGCGNCPCCMLRKFGKKNYDLFNIFSDAHDSYKAHVKLMQIGILMIHMLLFLDLDQPINIMDEKDAEIKIEFLSPKEKEEIEKCNKVETDVSFEIQFLNSSPFSQIKYLNKHSWSVEEFVFQGNSEINLRFDGNTLTCYSNPSNCQSLEEGKQVPVVLLSFHFKPRKGYKPTWQTLGSNTNKFSIRGSYYSTRCGGNS